MFSGSICDVKGILVGNAQDHEAMTGVTAVLCPMGAVGGVDVRGAAPGTRETDLLRCGSNVRMIHGIMLCGGSAFGLAAADGAMRWLAENEYGLEVGAVRVPIVPAAVIFDLGVGCADVHPDSSMGYLACSCAGDSFEQGSYGAGCGATVGKLIPRASYHKGGLGSASIRLPSGITVAAIAAVNAAGDVYHPHTGAVLACGTLDGNPVLAERHLLDGNRASGLLNQNTTIGIVATDAVLTKEQVNRLALTAHDGLARVVRPVHTEYDGDTIFSLATGDAAVEMGMISLCNAAAEVFARAVVNAVEAAR